MATGIGAVKQAFVSYLRSITALTTVVGSDGFHEGVAIRTEAYPYIVYAAYGVRSPEFGGTETMRWVFDVQGVSSSQVEAHNLDAALDDALRYAALSISGQSTLYCRRVSDLSFAGMDDAGHKVYQVGGSYSIWSSH